MAWSHWTRFRPGETHVGPYFSIRIAPSFQPPESTRLRLLRTWLGRKPIIPGLKQGHFGHAYPTVSWYCLLAGMGLFPEQLRPPSAREARHNLAGLDNMLARSALNYPDHRALLDDIPPRTQEPTLQIYLW